MEAQSRAVPPEASLGCLAAEYLWGYPPGIPLVLPGQRVTPPLLDAIRAIRRTGGTVFGSKSGEIGPREDGACAQVHILTEFAKN
jgi:arginine/lysine/ornithine decarboxylase